MVLSRVKESSARGRVTARDAVLWIMLKATNCSCFHDGRKFTISKRLRKSHQSASFMGSPSLAQCLSSKSGSGSVEEGGLWADTHVR